MISSFFGPSTSERRKSAHQLICQTYRVTRLQPKYAAFHRYDLHKSMQPQLLKTQEYQMTSLEAQSVLLTEVASLPNAER